MTGFYNKLNEIGADMARERITDFKPGLGLPGTKKDEAERNQILFITLFVMKILCLS